MFKRVLVGFVLGCSALLLAGCGGRADPGEAATPDQAVAAPPATEPTPGATVAETRQVTLHVKDMSERLELT